MANPLYILALVASCAVLAESTFLLETILGNGGQHDGKTGTTAENDEYEEGKGEDLAINGGFHFGVNGNLDVSGGHHEVSDGHVDVNDGRHEVNRGHIDVNGGRHEVSDGHVDVNDGRHEVNRGHIDVNDGRHEVIDGHLDINGGRHEVNRGQVDVNDGHHEVNDGHLDINGGRHEENRGHVEVNDGHHDVKGQFPGNGGYLGGKFIYPGGNIMYPGGNIMYPGGRFPGQNGGHIFGRDYCRMSTCERGQHSMCKFKYNVPSPTCGRVTSHTLTISEIQELLHAYNELHYKGQAPLVKWDEELAISAQRWANQCQHKVDVCRNSERFQVGQSFSWLKSTGPFTANLSRLVVLCDMPKGTRYVGCGLVRYNNDHRHNTSFLVCNYAKGYIGY